MKINLEKTTRILCNSLGYGIATMAGYELATPHSNRGYALLAGAISTGFGLGFEVVRAIGYNDYNTNPIPPNTPNSSTKP